MLTECKRGSRRERRAGCDARRLQSARGSRGGGLTSWETRDQPSGSLGSVGQKAELATGAPVAVYAAETRSRKRGRCRGVLRARAQIVSAASRPGDGQR